MSYQWLFPVSLHLGMNDIDKLVRKFETDDVIVGIRADGILHAYYKPNTVVDVPLQMQVRDFLIELTGNVKHPTIFQAGEFISLTKEARDNAITMEDKTPTLLTVVVVRNFAQKLIADFYYKVNKPKQPYKVVWQFEKGIQWLLEEQKKMSDPVTASSKKQSKVLPVYLF